MFKSSTNIVIESKQPTTNHSPAMTTTWRSYKFQLSNFSIWGLLFPVALFLWITYIGNMNLPSCWWSPALVIQRRYGTWTVCRWFYLSNMVVSHSYIGLPNLTSLSGGCSMSLKQIYVHLLAFTGDLLWFNTARSIPYINGSECVKLEARELPDGYNCSIKTSETNVVWVNYLAFDRIPGNVS